MSFSRKLGVLVIATFAASAACSSTTPAEGTERGACYPNGTCNSGLTCLSNTCVAIPADSGADTPLADAPAADVPGVDGADAVGADGPAAPDALVDVSGPMDTGAGMDSGASPDASDSGGGGDAGATDVFVEGGIPCPGAAIFHPGTECRVIASSVPFVGYARTPTCAPITGSSLSWSDNLEGAIGTGEMFSHTFVTLGMHTVTLTASAGGATYTARLTFPIQATCP